MQTIKGKGGNYNRGKLSGDAPLRQIKIIVLSPTRPKVGYFGGSRR